MFGRESDSETRHFITSHRTGSEENLSEAKRYPIKSFRISHTLSLSVPVILAAPHLWTEYTTLAAFSSSSKVNNPDEFVETSIRVKESG